MIVNVDGNILAVALLKTNSNDMEIIERSEEKNETIPFGLIQRLNQSSKSHLYFRITEQFAHNNQLQNFCCCHQTSMFVTVVIDFAYHLLD